MIVHFAISFEITKKTRLTNLNKVSKSKKYIYILKYIYKKYICFDTTLIGNIKKISKNQFFYLFNFFIKSL